MIYDSGKVSLEHFCSCGTPPSRSPCRTNAVYGGKGAITLHRNPSRQRKDDYDCRALASRHQLRRDPRHPPVPPRPRVGCEENGYENNAMMVKVDNLYQNRQLPTPFMVGNAKTTMIAALSPANINYEETSAPSGPPRPYQLSFFTRWARASSSNSPPSRPETRSPKPGQPPISPPPRPYPAPSPS